MIVLGAIFNLHSESYSSPLSFFYINIQLIEAETLYPRVVGQSIGLPAFFTLAAASIGGNLLAFIWDDILTPIFAVIYRLLRNLSCCKGKSAVDKNKFNETC